MKLKIKRPSTYIRYKDADLTPEERDRQKWQQLLIHDARKITLAMAKPVWGPAWERTAERLVQDEVDAGDS